MTEELEVYTYTNREDGINSTHVTEELEVYTYTTWEDGINSTHVTEELEVYTYTNREDGINIYFNVAFITALAEDGEMADHYARKDEL